MEELHKISSKVDIDNDDLHYGLEILEEADRITANKELLANIKEHGKKKAKAYTSIADLREKANEMALNPGQQAGQEDVSREKKAKRLAAKKGEKPEVPAEAKEEEHEAKSAKPSLSLNISIG